MRNSTQDWLLSFRALRAYLQIGLAAAIEAGYERAATPPTSPDFAGIVVHFAVIILLLFPLVYFGLPILTLAVTWSIAQFDRVRPAYACPVCEYDIHETPHRCPECGTKLRWGQLP